MFKTCFTTFCLFEAFFDDIALVGGFVDENVVFRKYIKNCASYGVVNPKAKMERIGVSLQP